MVWLKYDLYHVNVLLYLMRYYLYIIYTYTHVDGKDAMLSLLKFKPWLKSGHIYTQCVSDLSGTSGHLCQVQPR